MFFSLLIFSPINQLSFKIRNHHCKRNNLFKKSFMYWIHKYLLINISSCINVKVKNPCPKPEKVLLKNPVTFWLRSLSGQSCAEEGAELSLWCLSARSSSMWALFPLSYELIPTPNHFPPLSATKKVKLLLIKSLPSLCNCLLKYFSDWSAWWAHVQGNGKRNLSTWENANALWRIASSLLLLSCGFTLLLIAWNWLPGWLPICLMMHVLAPGNAQQHAKGRIY